MPSRQNLLSLTIRQIHKAVDSELCRNMLPKNTRPNIQKFLHECLRYNIDCLNKNNLYKDKFNFLNKESLLYFLKQELGSLISHILWKNFKLPKERPDPKVVKVEKFFQINDESEQKLSVLAENGIYFANDSGDFVSAACIESISNMTHVLDVHQQDDQSVIFFNIQSLHDLGLELVLFLSNNSYSDDSYLNETNSFASRANQEQWDKFAEFRILWHEKLDIKAIETLTPPKDNEDPKLFENELEKVLGIEKSKQLLKIEFDASKPILESYAEIISEISGLDKNVVLNELTDEDDINIKGDIVYRDMNHEDLFKKEKNYKHVGISLLIQTTKFDLTPTRFRGNIYDKESILQRLKNIEKSVVEFQIKYKKQVFSEAGDKAEELKVVMNNISLKGLELTKWLRGFVHYMLERRDIEQQILDYVSTIEGYDSKTSDWSIWWDNLSNNMAAGQSFLLCLIHRLFINNLVQSYLKFHIKEESKPTYLIEREFPEYFKTLPRFETKLGSRLLTATENIQIIESTNDISQPLMNELKNIKKALTHAEVIPTIQDWLHQTINSTEGLLKKIQNFKIKLGVKKLTIPCVFLNQPVQLILKFLGRGINYHQDLSDKPFSDNPALGEDIRCMCLMYDSASSAPET